MKFTLCKVAGGTNSDDRCRSAGALNGDGASTIAIVTESLGSEIVSESLDELRLEGSECGAADVVGAQTASFFMLANQLPLLRSARREHDGSGNGGSLLDVAPQVLCQSFPMRVHQVVAVSDPSDLLSYPIPLSIAEPNTTFVNVVRPLGHRLIAGTLVDPIGAHTQAKNYVRVQKMIACGFPSRCN